jgi:hypothetical protein
MSNNEQQSATTRGLQLTVSVLNEALLNGLIACGLLFREDVALSVAHGIAHTASVISLSWRAAKEELPKQKETTLTNGVVCTSFTLWAAYVDVCVAGYYAAHVFECNGERVDAGSLWLFFSSTGACTVTDDVVLQRGVVGCILLLLLIYSAANRVSSLVTLVWPVNTAYWACFPAVTAVRLHNIAWTCSWTLFQDVTVLGFLLAAGIVLCQAVAIALHVLVFFRVAFSVDVGRPVLYAMLAIDVLILSGSCALVPTVSRAISEYTVMIMWAFVVLAHSAVVLIVSPGERSAFINSADSRTQLRSRTTKDFRL